MGRIRRTTILREIKRAEDLSKEILKGRNRSDRINNLAVHGIVMGEMYALAWVLGEVEESPVDYARRRLENNDE